MLLNKDKASSGSMHIEYTKSDYCLCLAIHAPRKGIIEVSITAESHCVGVFLVSL
jgi:Rab3 GTPase-activating protein non-catalytic subunit